MPAPPFRLESDFAPVGEVAVRSEGIPPGTLVSDVADRFLTTPGLEALCVVDDPRPVGLVVRTKFLQSLFRRFGWELYARRPVETLAYRDPLTVRLDVPLDEALARAVARSPEDMYDDLVVVDADGRFHGLLPVRQVVILHSRALANIIVQKDLARARSEELERLGALRTQFLAHVTHELRSPVNAIIELAELLRVSAEKGYVGQVSDRLSLLLANATGLRAVITNILDLSKIEAGKMSVLIEEFDLHQLLSELVETTRVLVGLKPVTVAPDACGAAECLLKSDPVKVRQILLNLLTNAAKFTERGSIALRHRIADGAVELAVADTGIGIRPEDQDRLFTAFTQLESPQTRRHEGSGLGLAITAQLAALLRGSVRFTSAPGEGSAFTVRLPLRPEVPS